MAAPTPVSALVHSSTLVTAGVYLMIRLNCVASRVLLMGVSSFTMFIARVGAVCETDIKKVIALSTLRQLGMIMITIRFGL